ncbi:peptidase Do [compost metagenome]
MRISSKLIVCLAVAMALILPVAHGDSADGGMTRGLVHIWSLGKTKDDKVFRSSGSGFVLNADGYIATNQHVVGQVIVLQSKALLYVNPNESTFNSEDILNRPNAEVVWTSKDLDLAIIRYRGQARLEPVTLTDRIPKQGNPVIAVGYPGVADAFTSATRDIHSIATISTGLLGRVNSAGTLGGGPLSVLQHSAPINPGNSGGPLFDECGRVIGVNTAYALLDGQGPAQGINAASDINELIRNLNSQSVAYSLDSSPCQSAKEVYQQEQDRLKRLLTVSVGGGAAALLTLAVVVLLVARRPRERVLRAVESLSRSVRPQAAREAQEPIFRGVRLDGRTPSGQAVRIDLPAQALSAGVLLGRKPDDPRGLIADQEVSGRHATLQFSHGVLRVRDEGSTNGTTLNGRPLQAHRDEVLGAGDRLQLGGTELRLTFY